MQLVLPPSLFMRTKKLHNTLTALATNGTTYLHVLPPCPLGSVGLRKGGLDRVHSCGIGARALTRQR
eukprot:scaffold284095_cov36-Tisochrysis_lutea.AAC.2